eukprot:scaffold137449_cov29-Tisochrysis_lutea.AAC.4
MSTNCPSIGKILRFETAAMIARPTATRRTTSQSARLLSSSSQLMGHLAPAGAMKFSGRVSECRSGSDLEQCERRTKRLVTPWETWTARLEVKFETVGDRRMDRAPGKWRAPPFVGRQVRVHTCRRMSGSIDVLSSCQRGGLRVVVPASLHASPNASPLWYAATAAACRASATAPLRPGSNPAYRVDGVPRPKRLIMLSATRALSQQPKFRMRTDAPTRLTSSCEGASSSVDNASASAGPEAQAAPAAAPPHSDARRYMRRATATASKVGWARKSAAERWETTIVSQ